MDKKEYLNEEQYQKTNKKVGLIGKILLIVGGISFIVCSILIFGNFLSLEISGLIGFLWVVSFAITSFGLMLFRQAHSRQLMAYMLQQQMPIVQEGTEKIAPTIGKAGAKVAKAMAPAYGDIAKEVSKGIKEGLKDEEK